MHSFRFTLPHTRVISAVGIVAPLLNSSTVQKYTVANKADVSTFFIIPVEVQGGYFLFHAEAQLQFGVCFL